MSIYIGVGKKPMQGPCPDGFHVPSITEWEGLYTIMEGLSLTTSSGWSTNLHMPFAGYRKDSDASVGYQGSYGFYWASSPSESSSYARRLYLYSTLSVASLSTRASGLSVRCFKNEYVTPDSSWTVVQGTLGSAGIFWNQSEGLISITDGTTGYTMMDKNLGATTVYNNGDTLSQANMGNMYQWGNNYGFPSTGTISKTSSTQVNASSYGPTNPYSSDTFIIGNYNWSSVGNDDLWGAVSAGGVPPEISNVYLGTTPAREVYVGTTLVRPIIKDATIERLLVGGGGAGGRARCRAGGGGGAGGLIYCASETLPIGTCRCVVIGSGGVGGTTCYNGNYKGGNSCFGSVVAYGGGGGGGMCNYNRACPGTAGGSGGGGSACAGAGGGACNSSYGNAGGAGYNTTGGGGGGAGGAGCGASGAGNYYGGAGGCGCTFNISGTSVVYASGGGGGGCTGRSNSQGGGCGGCYRVAGCAATTYGSGGGGGGCTACCRCCMAGGNGCQGIFIARYPSNCKFNVTGGTKYLCNGYCVHCFTSNGTLCVS